MTRLGGRPALVTGCDGLIGSRLVEILVAAGNAVTGIDRNDGPREDLDLDGPGTFDYVQGDLGGEGGIKGIVGPDTVVFHLAAIAHTSECREDVDTALRVNVAGTQRVLAACGAGNPVVFLSSALVYGDPERSPIDEDHPLGGLAGGDPYTVTKRAGELLCLEARRARGVPVRIVRNFTTYGPRQRDLYLLPTILKQGIERGAVELWNPRPVRDWTYVDDAIEALLRLAETDDAAGRTVNLCSGRGCSVREIADAVRDVLDVPVTFLDRPVSGSMHLVGSNARLEALTGWKPTVDLADGIARTVDWMRGTLAAR